MKKCSVCGKEQKYLSKGMCSRHYQQIIRFGKIINYGVRSKNSLNEIIIHEDYAEIVLYDNFSNEIGRALIDVEFVEYVKNFKWYSKEGYCKNNKIGFLHRFIMNYPDDMVVDHINHDTLDNRKSNLRICTYRQNSMNTKISSNNTSGTTGVYYRNDMNKWTSKISVDGKLTHLGCFNTFEDAEQTRLQAELEYFGEFSPNYKLNI